MRAVYKKIEKDNSSTPHGSEYLFNSIQQLITNTNDNEKKLDDIFLKQSTIPNLLFTSAFLSPAFRDLLTKYPLFMYIYLGVMCSFFVTLFSAIVATTIERRNAKHKLKRSQALYTSIKDKPVLSSGEEDSIRKRIDLNNQTDDGCLLAAVCFAEDMMRIINSIFMLIFTIYGVFYVR